MIYAAIGKLGEDEIVWAIAPTAEAAIEDATEEARICEIDPGVLRAVVLTPKELRRVGRGGKFKTSDIIDTKKETP